MNDLLEYRLKRLKSRRSALRAEIARLRVEVGLDRPEKARVLFFRKRREGPAADNFILRAERERQE